MFSIRFVAAQLLGAFALAQILGIVVGGMFISQQVSVVENPSDPSNAIYFFGGILAMTVVLLLVMRFYRGTLLFKAMETVLVFVTSDLFLSLFLPPLPSAIGAFGLVAARFLLEQIRQPLLLFSTIVVGALLGASLDFFPVLLFAVLLAAYDFVAVFMTKHMITLAKALDDRKSSFTVAFRQKKEAVQLGTGDFVIPIIFSVAVSKAFGLPAAVLCALGATAGLASLLFLMEKRKGYYPGLPPIVLAELAVLGLFIGSKAIFG